MSAAAPASTVLTRERLVLAHAGLVTVVAAWMLGGIGETREWIVAALATPSLYFLVAEARVRRRAGDGAGFRRLLRWGAPFTALAALVVISALNPSHRPAFLYDTFVLRPVPHVEWLPASARPLASLRQLACLGGLFCTGLTLAFCVHSRRGLRALLLAVAVNALALAVLGTVQKQTDAAGPFFDLVTAPNVTWFATFLYHNHWGAFAVLSVCAALALVFHSLRHPPDRGWQHGPGPLLALAAVLIAATAPLTSSRSTTLLMAALGLAATLTVARRAWAGGPGSRSASRSRARPGSNSSSPPARRRMAAVGVAVALLLLGGLVALQSRAVITERARQTAEQFSALRAGDVGYSRADLYADTWRMAADKPVFGWGLESYGSIFLRYSRFRPGVDGLMNTFEDAHSDWLQAMAELGFVGTALLLALALVPLVETLRGGGRPSGASAWLLGGCALVALYAWVEFPFANPAVVGLWWLLFFTALRLVQLGPVSSARSA